MKTSQIMLDSKIQTRELNDIEISNLRKCLLIIYTDILTVCKENGFVCYLGGGTCLGAIRHKGFIPWDDDMDLNMLRKEYNKLPELLMNKFPDKYIIDGPGYSKNSSYNCLKIGLKGTLLKTIFDDKKASPCIAIDLFPIENIPQNKIVNLFHGFLINCINYIGICTQILQKETIAKTVKGTNLKSQIRYFLRKVIAYVFSFKSYTNWFLLGDKISSKDYKSKYTTVPTGRRHYFGEIQKYSDLFPPVECTFEGIQSLVYNNYDKYLSDLYGNYMEIPPINKREKHFFTDIQFGEYKIKEN